MAKDIVTKAEILGGEIDVRANFGQTVKVTVSPDPYMGDTEVTPSDQTQVLQTKKKFVQEDITVHPAPTETLSTTENGQFTPSEGYVGFSKVDVNVNPDLRPLSVSENGQYSPDGFDGYSEVTVDVPATGYGKGTLIYEGDFATNTDTFSVKTTPDGQPFSFDKIDVELSINGEGPNSGWRQYWRRDLPMTGNHAHVLNAGVGRRTGATMIKVKNVITVEDDTYIRLLSFGYAADNPIYAEANGQRLAHDGYNKITAYGWWAWECSAGTHIKITGYNRTA